MAFLKTASTDFFRLQTVHRRKSILLFLLLCLFFIVCVVFFLLASFGVFFIAFWGPDASFETLLRLICVGVILATFITSLNVFDAMRNGPSAILKRLNAEHPDPSDLYHKRFMNVADEVAVSGAIRTLELYVIPDASINSMALLLKNRIPAIAVTEGMLAALTRDELQAVIAHEVSHILSGDLHFITLVVSVMTTFERLAQSTADQTDKSVSVRSNSTGVSVVMGTSGFLSYVLIRLLSTMVSRERELKTDAQAIELSRHPTALATAIFKAYKADVSLGDFSLAYSPVFIVSPDMSCDDEGPFDQLFNTHPPIEKRLAVICRIAGIDRGSLSHLIAMQEHLQVNRTVRSLDEIEHSGATIPVLDQMQLIIPGIAIDSASDNDTANLKCPRCQVDLITTTYEGTDIESCPDCRGALVHPSTLMRILIRREFQFSDSLKQKARALRKQLAVNPLKTSRKDHWRTSGIQCPYCRIPMNSRPYSYHHFLPIDRCYRCKRIWFDSNELEILQILVER